MAANGSTMSPAQNGGSVTPSRLGRRQAMPDLKAAAASSPSHPGQSSPKPIGSPQKQTIRSSKAATRVTSTSSKTPSSTSRGLSNSINSLGNAKTPRTIRGSLKMSVPATPTSTTTQQKENVTVEDSPLRMRTSASKRATLKKSSKNSIKIKELRLVQRNEQIDQDLKKPVLSTPPSLAPKAVSGRIKLRPKFATLEVVVNAEATTPSERMSTIKQTTSGLNIHNLAASTSSNRYADVADVGPHPAKEELKCSIAAGKPEVDASAVEIDGFSVSSCTPTEPVCSSAKKVNKPDSLNCSSNLKALECFSTSLSLLAPAELVSTDSEGIEPANMSSFHAVGQMLMTGVGNSEQILKPELETPLSIPTVVLPAILETDNTDDVNMDGGEIFSSISSSEVSFPRANVSIGPSHSTATCGSYAPSVCPSTPTKSRPTLAVTPVSKRLPRTAPSTPSSSPGSAYAFYHLLLLEYNTGSTRII